MSTTTALPLGGERTSGESIRTQNGKIICSVSLFS